MTLVGMVGILLNYRGSWLRDSRSSTLIFALDFIIGVQFIIMVVVIAGSLKVWDLGLGVFSIVLA